MEEAVALGLEFLNEEDTKRVIREISNLFINMIDEDIPDKPKKKKK